MTNHIKEIQDLENKFGLMLFSMALAHLVDVGARNLTDEDVEAAIAQITTEEEVARVNGRFPIMTAEFQIQIVRCAADLAKFSISDLFCYIKEHVHIKSR